MPRSNRTIQKVHDELLILRSQDGEPEALEELILRWRARLHAHAWNLTRDAEGAADVSQETWIAIVKGLRRLSDPALFGPWAYRIVSHKCADWTRRRQRRRRLLTRAKERSERTAKQDAHAELGSLHAALADLRPDSRAVLSMHYLGEMNVNQIATALDIPVGTVKSRLYHARQDLKKAIEKEMS